MLQPALMRGASACTAFCIWSVVGLHGEDCLQAWLQVTRGPAGGAPLTESQQLRREPSDTQRVHPPQPLELEWHPASSQPVPEALRQQLLRHDAEAAVRTQHPPLWRRFSRPVLDFGTAMVGDRVHLRMLLFNRGQLAGLWVLCS